MLTSFELKEDFYVMHLTKYMNRNPGTTEVDFLQSELILQKEYLEECSIITQTEIKNSLRKKHLSADKKPPESWIEQNAIREWDRVQARIKSCESVTRYCEIKLNRLIPESFQTKSTMKVDKWLDPGVRYATGEMDQLLIEHQTSSEVSRILYGDDFKKYRPYISSSTSKDHRYGGKAKYKNIYACYDKMKKIIDHCRKNNIEISQEFIEKYELIKPH